MENRCVCCGEIIPEGRQICLQCEGLILIEKPKTKRKLQSKRKVKQSKAKEK